MDREGIHPGIIAAALVAVVGLAGLLFWAFGTDRTPEAPKELGPTPATSADPATAPTPAPAPPPLVLPALDDSDPLLRELVGRLSSRPEWVGWLVGEDLARTFVAAIDNVARGESPRQQLAFLEPEGGFDVVADDGVMRIDPKTFARYDLVTDVITALDTEGMVALYQQLLPLFEQAYRDLGYPEGSFAEQLATAVQLLAETPVVEDPAIRLDVTNYVFDDGAVEALSPAQKHLLRMGAANVSKLQEKLSRLAAAAGLDDGT